MTTFTPDQARAISARGKNLLLSAAAGSGKTTVLVERVLSLLSEGANLDEMLIVTFSRAAAADMKAKLSRALSERAIGDPALASQLEKLELTSVETLHTFCAQVLRSHFEQAGVDPAFRIVEETENEQIARDAMDAALEEACEAGGADFASLIFGRGARGAGRLAAELYTFSRQRPEPEKWLKKALADAPDPAPWISAMLTGARRTLREAAAYLEEAAFLCEAPLGPLSYQSAIEDDLRSVADFLSLSYEALSAAASGFTLTKIKGLRVDPDDPDADARLEIKEQVLYLREEAKKRVKKLADDLLPPEGALSDLEAGAGARRALCALTSDYASRIARQKAERALLSYDDLEHAALRALRAPAVAASLQARFTHVFVDEYQDVSDLQEAIVQRVARPGALFMVGDVKQSIYRFRQAEPSLFIDKYDRYERGDGGELVALSTNFRSRPLVLDYVNRVFERAFSGTAIRYDEKARMYPGAAYEGEDPAVVLHIIAGDEEDEGGSEAAFDMSAAQREGALAASVIKGLIGQPLYDASKKKTRAIAPKDIAVLSRTNAGLLAALPYLRDAGIPAYADIQGGYLDALEVRVMRALLSLIENRRRDEPLLSVLRSPIGGFTTTDLAALRAAHPQGNLRSACVEAMSAGDALGGRLSEFEKKLDRWRALSACLPLTDFFDLLLRETGYYAFAGAMPGGAARQGNLDLLCRYAGDFEALFSGGLTGFLSYLKDVEKTGGDMGSAHELGEGDDVVRLMTTHKSKGLEFPVVVATQMGRRFSQKGGKSELLTHRELGAGFYHMDEALCTRRDTLPRRAIRAQLDQEDLEEEARVLYVMMTRAKERLVLIGSERSRRKAELRYAVCASAPVRPANFLDMLLPAATNRETLLWHGAGAPPTPSQAVEAPTPDPALVASFHDAYTWRYPFEGEAFIPLKLTVTGLAREITGVSAPVAINRRPRFLSEATPAQKGTLTHAALRALPLDGLAALSGKALEREIRARLQALLTSGALAEAVDPAPICAFFARETGRRMLRSPRVEREWPFNLRMSAREALDAPNDQPLLVQGVIDCCYLEEDGWTLIDYKTDRVTNEAETIERYKPQLALYKKALERITKTPVPRVILSLMGAGRDIDLSF